MFAPSSFCILTALQESSVQGERQRPNGVLGVSFQLYYLDAVTLLS